MTGLIMFKSGEREVTHFKRQARASRIIAWLLF
jgi:hypothetical protein